MVMDKRKQYFIRQKLYGVGLLVLTAVIFMVMTDVTFTLVTAPLGLWLLFTKEMVITDDYFFEVNEEKEEEF